MTWSRAMLILLFFTIACSCFMATESSGGFLGGMDIQTGFNSFSHPDTPSDGQLLHIGGGGGGKLGSSPWVLGGRGASASLVSVSREAELDMRYGGLLAIYLIPLEPITFGIEAFVGGGSYALFSKENDLYIKHSESFFLAEPRLHIYYTPIGKLILDLHAGYTFTTADALDTKGIVLGFGILFGAI
jgi:hypothetical protein